MHKPLAVKAKAPAKKKSAKKAAVTDEVISPRDAASGLPTGKRMHKPTAAKTKAPAKKGAPKGPPKAAMMDGGGGVPASDDWETP